MSAFSFFHFLCCAQQIIDFELEFIDCFWNQFKSNKWRGSETKSSPCVLHVYFIWIIVFSYVWLEYLLHWINSNAVAFKHKPMFDKLQTLTLASIISVELLFSSIANSPSESFCLNSILSILQRLKSETFLTHQFSASFSNCQDIYQVRRNEYAFEITHTIYLVFIWNWAHQYIIEWNALNL